MYQQNERQEKFSNEESGSAELEGRGNLLLESPETTRGNDSNTHNNESANGSLVKVECGTEKREAYYQSRLKREIYKGKSKDGDFVKIISKLGVECLSLIMDKLPLQSRLNLEMASKKINSLVKSERYCNPKSEAKHVDEMAEHFKKQVPGIDPISNEREEKLRDVYEHCFRSSYALPENHPRCKNLYVGMYMLSESDRMKRISDARTFSHNVERLEKYFSEDIDSIAYILARSVKNMESGAQFNLKNHLINLPEANKKRAFTEYVLESARNNKFSKNEIRYIFEDALHEVEGKNDFVLDVLDRFTEIPDNSRKSKLLKEIIRNFSEIPVTTPLFVKTCRRVQELPEGKQEILASLLAGINVGLRDTREPQKNIEIEKRLAGFLPNAGMLRDGELKDRLFKKCEQAVEELPAERRGVQYIKILRARLTKGAAYSR